MVTVEGLTKKYGRHTVLADVSLVIPKGQITSIIGPNGAGKSTMLSILSRLIPADAGSIRLEGRDIGSFPTDELAKRISILKQSNHINLRLTVRDLVSFGRFPHSHGRLTADDWDHVDQAIRFMGLEDTADKYLDHLSGGQKQRAFLAMVIAQDTDYVFLDEPLNNLDMKHSVIIMRTLRRLVDELGKTVVIVLHDINFASIYSDHIIALKDGEVVGAGPVHDMITREVLSETYEMDIDVEHIQNCRICLYFSAPLLYGDRTGFVPGGIVDGAPAGKGVHADEQLAAAGSRGIGASGADR